MASAKDELRRHLEAAYPEEAIGALWDTDRGVTYQALDNIAADRARSFVVDVGAMAKIMTDARAAGRTLRAWVHSHPHGPAHLSAEDQRMFVAGGEPTYPGVALVVGTVTAEGLGALNAYVYDRSAREFRPSKDGIDVLFMKTVGSG